MLIEIENFFWVHFRTVRYRDIDCVQQNYESIEEEKKTNERCPKSYIDKITLIS